MQAEGICCKACRAKGNEARSQVAQANPDVEEQKGQPQQEEAKSGIAGAGSRSQITELAIGGFNAKTSPVALTSFRSRPIQMHQDEHQPGPRAFARLLIGLQAGNDSQTRGRTVAESIGRAIALASMTQRPRTTRFASNGAGQHGRQMFFVEVGDDFSFTERLVRIQHAWHKAKLLHTPD